MGPGLRRDGEKVIAEIVTMFVEANWVTPSFAGGDEGRRNPDRMMLLNPGRLNSTQKTRRMPAGLEQRDRPARARRVIASVV